MSMQVSIRDGESQEALLRRFQRMVQTSGILREAKVYRHFISRGEKERMKAQKSARRRRRQLNSAKQPNKAVSAPLSGSEEKTNFSSLVSACGYWYVFHTR